MHDVALQHLPVVLCFDRAGLVGEDGATHHGCFDIAALRTVPGTIISSPKDETELKQLMYTALGTESGPFIIRYPRGCGEGAAWKDAPAETLPIGKAVELKAGRKISSVQAEVYDEEDNLLTVGLCEYVRIESKPIL